MKRILHLVCTAVLAAAVSYAAEEAPKVAAPDKAAASPESVAKETSAAFLAKVDADPSVKKMPSGLRFKAHKDGQGFSPATTDIVKVHYRGTLVDGTEFDSSYKRDAPATFPLNAVIACWTEGLQLMKPGGKATLYCPAEIAYGERGYPGLIPAGSTLVFEVELIGVEGPKKGPEAVAPPPKK